MSLALAFDLDNQSFAVFPAGVSPIKRIPDDAVFTALPAGIRILQLEVTGLLFEYGTATIRIEPSGIREYAEMLVSDSKGKMWNVVLDPYQTHAKISPYGR
jgi:hypothetical protein